MGATLFMTDQPQLLNSLPEGVLLLPISGETLCIPLNSIIRIEASSNYSKVFCKYQSFPVVAAKVLKWFEERLSRDLFVRIHRSHLINKMYVVSVKNNNVRIEPGMEISISRRKRKKLYGLPD